MRERKFKKTRTPHKIFLVICEGETEKVYIEALRSHYRIPVTIKTRVSGNSINSRLVEQYVNELGVTGPNEYSIFYIYDADVKCITDKLQMLPGTLILSNPCLELWYILHSIDHNRDCNSDQVIRILKDSHPVWKQYSKGRLSIEQNSLLMMNRLVAVNRAKKLCWPQNPSSNMELFIEVLENAKNG